MLRVCTVRTSACLVTTIAAIAVAGCGSATITTGTSTSGAATQAPKLDSTPGITAYWRAQVAVKYNGPVARGDGRGCARSSRTRWVCTAHIQNLNKDIDVYGTVRLEDHAPIVAMRLNHGNQITAWFTRTGGGCQTNSCQGTRFR